MVRLSKDGHAHSVTADTMKRLCLPQIAILVGAGVAACSDYRSGPKLQPRVKSAHPDGLVATASDSASLSSAEDQAHVSQPQQTNTANDDSLPVRAALAGLQFYRTAISPLMPSSCRFQPTCSFYSIDSYKRYGAMHGGCTLQLTSGDKMSGVGMRGKGLTVMLAVVMDAESDHNRCKPPPGLAAVFGEGSWEYAPHASVVLGAALASWLMAGLWHEVAAIVGLAG
ncbi:hypothetical protein QJQ45_028448 [Haematococcus lacustris]|nr:hypothetical protein QJQ45_028448 [Haematococcus lacustris]